MLVVSVARQLGLGNSEPWQFRDAKDDIVVLRPGQPGVGPKKPIPGRQDSCVIAAPLCERDRMVESVHFDGDKHQLQPAVKPLRQANVAVLDGLDGK
jgi:hypothetical protein